jgi:diguanylate cyclase (GGDEF)-like protein
MSISHPPLLLYSAFDTLELGIILLNQQREIVLWNRWMVKASGLKSNLVAGLKLETACPELQHSRLSDALDLALSKGQSAMLSQSLNQAPFNLYRPDAQQGQSRMQQSIQITPLPQYNGDIFCLIQIHDVTNSVLREKILHERAEAMQRYAYQDELTTISNRTIFAKTFQEVWRLASRQHNDIALLMIDVDYFTRYNEKYGHLAGDQCLRTIAQALQNTMRRPEDLVARFGGEEFIVLLPNTHLAGAKIMAQRLWQAIIDLNHSHAASPLGQITVSIGCASIRAAHELDPSQLHQEVELALFFAKQNGRNQIHDSHNLPQTGATLATTQ